MTVKRVGEEVKVRLRGGDGGDAVHDCILLHETLARCVVKFLTY